MAFTGLIDRVFTTFAARDAASYLEGDVGRIMQVKEGGGSLWQLADLAPSWNQIGAAPQQTLTDGANIALDLSKGNSATVTLAGNRTLDNPTGIRSGETYLIEVVQDGTGSRTLTWGSAYDFAGGTPPTLSTGAADVDRFVFVATDSTQLTLTGSALDVS